jgi:hypothetical protein
MIGGIGPSRMAVDVIGSSYLEAGLQEAFVQSPAAGEEAKKPMRHHGHQSTPHRIVKLQMEQFAISVWFDSEGSPKMQVCPDVTPLVQGVHKSD